jgi:hypothetical protein
MLRRIALAFAISTILFSTVSEGKNRKINCDGQFVFEKAKISITADVLKKVSVDLKKENDVLAKVDEWTSVALSSQRALCDAYKAGDETTFPTEKYLSQLEALRAWELEFFKLTLTLTKVQDSKADPNKAGASEELKTNLKDLQNHFDTILAQKPTAQAAVRE